MGVALGHGDAGVAEEVAGLGEGDAGADEVLLGRACKDDPSLAHSSPLLRRVPALVRLQGEGERRISRLTREQEEELVADVRLLLVALLVRNRWGFEDIVREYAISETECVRLLARLDRLRLIELQPGNRVRLLVARNFRWIPGGPIERFFERHV